MSIQVKLVNPARGSQYNCTVICGKKQVARLGTVTDAVYEEWLSQALSSNGEENAVVTVLPKFNAFDIEFDDLGNAESFAAKLWVPK